LNLLSQNGVISSSLSGLITQLASAIPGLVASLLSGKGVTNDIIAILTAIQAEVQTLKKNNSLLTLNEANEITALDDALSDALTAYKESQVTTAPSTLTPLPETL